MINNDLHSIFSALKILISCYQPPLVVKGNDATHYDVWFVKDLVIAGRKCMEVFFAGLIIQKSYVGFLLYAGLHRCRGNELHQA